MNKTPEIDVNIDVLAPAARRDEEQIDIEDVLSMEPATRQSGSVQPVGHFTPPKTLLALWDKVGVATMQPEAVKKMSAAELVQQIVKADQTANAWRIWQGYLAHVGRELHGRGAMAKAAEEVNVSRSSLYNYVDLYQLCARCPDANLDTIVELDMTKGLALKSLPDDVLARVVSGEPVADMTLKEAKELNKSEFAQWAQMATMTAEERAMLEDLREQKARMADELLKKDAELSLAKDELKLAAGYERFEKSFNFISPDVLEIREEAYATTDVMLGGLNTLRNLYERFLGAKATELFSQPPNPRSHLDDNGQAEARVNCAATLYHNLAGAVAPALRLMQELEEAYGEGVGGSVLGHKYSEEELVLFQEKRDNLLAADEAARKFRAAQRHNKANAGRRGRPKKVEG